MGSPFGDGLSLSSFSSTAATVTGPKFGGSAFKDGVMWLKDDQESWERYVTLPLIPQEYGGCKDCRFWLMCRSQCPGTSIDGDWRNKTEHCEVWMSLFDSLETKMVANGETPLSLAPELPELE